MPTVSAAFGMLAHGPDAEPPAGGEEHEVDERDEREAGVDEDVLAEEDRADHREVRPGTGSRSAQSARACSAPASRS